MKGTTNVLRTVLQYGSLGVLGLLGSGATGCGVGCDLSTCDSGLRVQVLQYQPNGGNCDPICHVGDVTVSMR